MPFIVLSLILHTLQLKGKETPMEVECIDSHLDLNQIYTSIFIILLIQFDHENVALL